jgi:hypothetical protein
MAIYLGNNGVVIMSRGMQDQQVVFPGATPGILKVDYPLLPLSHLP